MQKRDEFTILIVGGGIAGLAAAIGLRSEERCITILERSEMLKETGALISLQPNASKIVSQWKLDAFLDCAEPLADRAFCIYDVHGQLASRIPLETAMFGAERMVYHRQDLHSALRSAATSPDLPGRPVRIQTASPVVSCDPDEGVVTTSNGQRLQADLIIGADGIKSVIRAAVLGESRDAVPTGISAYRLLVPSQLLHDIEGLPDSVTNTDSSMTSMLVGHDKRVIMGSGRGGRLFGMVALLPDRETLEDSTGDSWVRPGSKKQLLGAFDNFPLWLRTIFDRAPDDQISLWQLRDIDPLPTWIRGRAIIIGDAAHAMLPTQGQGASQSFEDAEALRAFFSGVESRPSGRKVQKVLERVFAARYQRASLIQAYSRQQARPTTAMRLDPGQFMKYNCEYNGAVEWLKRQSREETIVI